MKSEEQFEVRDLRDKDRFMLDHKFFNGYVRIMGTNALGVYCSLCRHADKNQKCWPSQKAIAEELSLSRATVIEWLKVLEYFNIIKKVRLGKECTNRYYLLNKKQWRSDWQVMSNELTSGDVKLFNISCQMVLLQGLNGLTSNSKKIQMKGNTRVSLTHAREKNIKFLIQIPEEDLIYFTSRFQMFKSDVTSKGEDLYNWCKANGRKKKNYRAFLLNAIKKDFREIPNWNKNAK